MPSNVFRLRCKSVNSDHRDLVIDAICNEEKRLVKMAMFGMQAPLADALPFVILINGDVDYGSEFKDEIYRIGRTNIRDKIIEIGELFTLWEHEESLNKVGEFTYKIVEMTRL